MKNVLAPTIRRYHAEHAQIVEKTGKLSWIVGAGTGTGTGALFLATFAILRTGPQLTEPGPWAAAAPLGAIFGLQAFLLMRTNHRYGKLDQLKRRFQADVRAYAEGQHGLAVQHDTIEPDLGVRVGYALKDGEAVPVKVWFETEDSPLSVVALTEASTR